MENEIRIGVYICHCGVNIAANVDVSRVADFVGSLPNVVISRHYQYMCSDPGQEMIKGDIKELKLNRVVVASCSPRMHEPTFRATVEEAKLNPYCFEMANIREQCSWVHENKEEATKKALKLVVSAVYKASLLEPLMRKEVDVLPAALVIGGGIAGIYAALEIADKGFKTYLVEKSPSIGGHMAQLDKTFPTLDCSACILTPKMVEVARHKNVELITYAEVAEVDGHIGNFKVKIRKKPRYVDEEKCTGCGECIQACPVVVPDEFNVGFGTRKAIYLQFPQAVPLVAVRDIEWCIDCGLCSRVCQAEAINFEQEEREIEINVGVIIVATGYDLLDARIKPEYGYGLYDNVLTGLEFERLCSASGPTQGKIKINGREPKEIAFIHCVGSRDKKGNQYCSRVCCMYTAKQAHIAKDLIPDAKVTALYTDMRAYGKGFEEFYNRVRDEGITYIKRDLEKPIKVERKEEESDKLIVMAENEHQIKIEADLVVLATSIIPNRDVKEVENILKITQSADNFFLEAHPKLRPVETATEGIFLAGCCQSPKDIPDSVAQACGAAEEASIPLFQGKVEIEPITSYVNEAICSGCRTCEEVCAYDALSFNEEKGVIEVNEVLCKGCGSCSSNCPSGAISMRHFKDEQVYAQIEAVS